MGLTCACVIAQSPEEMQAALQDFHVAEARRYRLAVSSFRGKLPGAALLRKLMGAAAVCWY